MALGGGALSGAWLGRYVGGCPSMQPRFLHPPGQCLPVAASHEGNSVYQASVPSLYSTKYRRLNAVFTVPFLYTHPDRRTAISKSQNAMSGLLPAEADCHMTGGRL